MDTATTTEPDPEDAFYDDDLTCWQCGGDGWGIVGDDWDCIEYGWDMPGDIETCPCCGGTGNAKDCRYW